MSREVFLSRKAFLTYSIVEGQRWDSFLDQPREPIVRLVKTCLAPCQNLISAKRVPRTSPHTSLSTFTSTSACPRRNPTYRWVPLLGQSEKPHTVFAISRAQGETFKRFVIPEDAWMSTAFSNNRSGDCLESHDEFLGLAEVIAESCCGMLRRICSERSWRQLKEWSQPCRAQSNIFSVKRLELCREILEGSNRGLFGLQKD